MLCGKFQYVFFCVCLRLSSTSDEPLAQEVHESHEAHPTPTPCQLQGIYEEMPQIERQGGMQGEGQQGLAPVLRKQNVCPCMRRQASTVLIHVYRL